MSTQEDFEHWTVFTVFNEKLEQDELTLGDYFLLLPHLNFRNSRNSDAENYVFVLSSGLDYVIADALILNPVSTKVLVDTFIVKLEDCISEKVSVEIINQYGKDQLEDYKCSLRSCVNLIRPYSNRPDLEITDNSVKSNKLTHPEIGLLYSITEQVINEHNKNTVALKYGQNSGHRVLQEFNKVRRPENRTRFDPIQDRIKIKHQIRRYENILFHISDKKRLDLALSEMEKLKLMIE